MAVSNCVKNTLCRAFKTSFGYRGYYRPYRRTSGFYNNSLYDLYLKCTVSENHFKLPILSAFYCSGNMTSLKSEIMPMEYVINLQLTNRVIKKSVSAMLNCSFNEVSGILYKLDNDKGNVYYIGGGIILDSDYKPLLLLNYEGDVERVVSDVEYYRYIIKKRNCTISSRVFINQDNDPMCKEIVRKIVPYYCSREGYMDYYGRISPQFDISSLDNYDVTIEVNDMDDLVYTPNNPLLEGSIDNDRLKKVIVDNTEAIVSNLI